LELLAEYPPDEDQRDARDTSAIPDIDRGVSLKTILDLLEGNESLKLARALEVGQLQTQESDWHARERLVEVLCILVGHALVRAGSAYWTMGWAGPSRLVDSNATQEEITTWVATAVGQPNPGLLASPASGRHERRRSQSDHL